MHLFKSQTCLVLFQFTKPVVIGTTKEEGNIYIRNESRKLSPERFVEVMTLNDIHLHISQAQTGKDQARMVTTHYFETPAISFLNQLDNNPHCWKLRLTGAFLMHHRFNLLIIFFRFSVLVWKIRGFKSAWCELIRT